MPDSGKFKDLYLNSAHTYPCHPPPPPRLLTRSNPPARAVARSLRLPFVALLLAVMAASLLAMPPLFQATPVSAQAENSPATGLPTISGTFQVGETLTADTSAIADEDGLNDVSYSYQWSRNDGNADTDIEDAADSTYTLVTADQGKTTKVKVSFTDDAGNAESLTSAATATVANADGCTRAAPTPVTMQVEAVPITVESTTEDYFVLYVRHDLDADTTFEVPVGVTLGQDGATTLTESLEALPKERYRVEKYLVSDPADVDGDCTDDITELADPVGMNPVNPVPAMSFDDGAAAIPNRETYVSLAYKGEIGAIDRHLAGLEAVKFHMVDMNTDRPSVYFMNTKTYRRHDDFQAAVGLEVDPLHGHETMVGEMVYHPKAVAPDGSLGVYRFQFGANDVYSFKEISYAFTVLAASMPLLEENLAYFPMWSKAVARYHKDQSLYDDSRVDVLLAEDIAFDLDFISLNPGEGFGFLRVMSLEERPNPRDIVIYETLPNDLSRVAGIITTVPQTPLSHVNLRAVQDGVPNSFIRDALKDGDIDGLIGSYVQYLVGSSGYFLRAATPEEVDAHYKASRPSETQTPERDLTVTEITALSDIEFDDWNAFGVKAANVAVLGTLDFPDGTVPDGYAVPFHLYDEFMKHNGFYDDVEEMLADSDFQSDFETQEKELKKLRKKIKKGETPEWIIAALTEMHSKYPEGQSLRYRSSTNNEDLPGFSGAGLYDSKTQHPDETEEDGIAKSLKQVYASLWNFRAFTEREFYRVGHLAAAMGVLVHPNYSDELANGVAVSFDPIRMRYGNYYVNSQLGEDLVTNPDAHSAPEEILLHRGGEYTVLATSNQMQRGQLLMSDAQMDQLRRHLELIHDEFAELYGVEAGEPFAMEIEFKITSDDILSIKQARPWVFGDDAPSENSPATGAPTISGTVQVNETLTADISGIADANGLTSLLYGSLYRYQWIRNDGTTETDIENAASSTYTLSDADVGKTIRVRVSFTDDRGYEETLTSATTTAVQPRPNSPATGAPTIIGKSETGETLTADTSGITDADGLTNVSYSYQWIANDGTTDTDIENATAATYTLVTADEGKTIKVKVSFTDDANNSETLTSAATPPVTRPNTPATGAPTISGTAQVGETLTADVSGIADADGLSSVSYSYQWIANDASTDTDISGQTGSTYTLVSTNVGKTIKLRVGFTDDRGHEESLVSAATTAVQPRPNTPATGAPTISGTAQVGGTLTADVSGIADADGLTNVSYTYQWIANDGTTGTDIENATAATYTLVTADQGKTIKARVSFTDDANNSETLTSDATATVPTTDEWWADMSVVDYGTGAIGAASADLFSNSGGDAGLQAKWLWFYSPERKLRLAFTDNVPNVNDLTLLVGDVALALQGGDATFTWEDVDVDWEDGQTLTARIVRDWTIAVVALNSPATGLPTIIGTAQAGETLTADTSGITDADGLTSVSYSYQWIRNDGNSDSDIPDATDTTYTLVSADEGKTIKVRVSFTDDAGNEETLTSAATAAVAAKPNSPATGAPTIGGAPEVGQTLTADVSGIADSDGLTNVSYSYQWIAGESDIDGANASNYTLTASEQGQTIKVKVSFTDDADHEETLTSAGTGVVAAKPNSPATGQPTISGTPQVDQTLTADTSPIDDADGLTNVSYRYQWIAGGSDIEGATGSTYTLTASEQGLSVLVRVSFTDDADNQETLTSEATAAVAARPNSPPTGAPTISGTAQSGETLTADVSGVGDADGLANVSYSYQWIRNDGNSDSDIPDATDTTYTLVSADEGKTIKVRVSFTDDADNQETLTSTTTVIVDQSGTVSLWPELPRVGTVVKATLTDPDGLEGAGSGAAASLGALSWQWSKSSEGSTWTSFDVGQDGNSYTPTGDDEGMWLKVTAVYTDGHGQGKSAEAITAATIGAREASPELTVTELATGLTHPWDIAFTPDGTMLFTERDDGLRVRLPDGTVRQVTADFSDLNFGGTAGLLALVLDPDFVSNRRFYTYQRHTGPEMQVIAWTIDQEYTTATRIADPLVGGIPVNPNRGPSHGGGRLRFGPEGYLWIATGDGFSGTAAQDLTSLGGKVLRVDSQTGAGAVGNPFAPSPVYTYGHRNPQGLALRPGTGQMWSVEHGPDHDDEINLLVSGGNYGWDPAPDEGVEGLYDETTTPMTDLVKFPDALQANWSSGYPTLAVGGGVFLEGSKWREWEGQFAVATLKTKSVRVFKFTEEGDLVSQAVVPELDRTYGRLRTAVLGPDGALYITTTNGGGKDKILKVVPANTPATGAPTIGGTAQVGETLTADISGITDADGLTNVSYHYQWIANDGTTDTDIQDATDSTYTLTDDDAGKTIKVRVSFTDDAGNEETLTSAATAAVAAKPNSPATGAPTIGGAPEVGQTLTADVSGIADADGLDNASYSYQWIRNDGSADADIQDATGSTYMLVSNDVGMTIKVRVTFTDDASNEETLTSVATATVVAAANNPATGAPTISGTAQVGETLTVDTTAIQDADGLDNAVFSYQWVAGGMDIQGATGSTYTLSGDDEELTVQVWVFLTDDAGNPEVFTSAATGAVAARPDSPATGQPTISGIAHAGQTLTAGTAGIADADGLDDAIFSYQWRANDGTTDMDIEDADDSTYTVSDDDVGKVINVRVSFTDDAGTEETLTSDPTASISQSVIYVVNPAAYPTNLVAEWKNGAVRLSWYAPKSDTDSITGYRVYRNSQPIVYSLGSGTRYRDPDATEAGSEYTYCVKAVRDGTNFGECSNHASITVPGETSDSTTPETTPDEGNRHPTNLTVSLVDGVVVLNWDAPTLEAGSITGYEVLRRRPNKGEYTLVPYGQAAGGTTFIDHNAIEPGVKYTYRVKALRGDEKSRWSNYANITIPK